MTSPPSSSPSSPSSACFTWDHPPITAARGACQELSRENSTNVCGIGPAPSSAAGAGRVSGRELLGRLGGHGVGARGASLGARRSRARLRSRGVGTADRGAGWVVAGRGLGQRVVSSCAEGRASCPLLAWLAVLGSCAVGPRGAGASLLALASLAVGAAGLGRGSPLRAIARVCGARLSGGGRGRGIVVGE